MIPILALANLLIYLIQLLLGLIAWNVRKSRAVKFNFPTSEQIEPAYLIEKYFYDDEYEFELKATDDIDEPAEANENFLWINRNILNRTDLFTNFYLIYQAELTSDKYHWFRRYNNIQSIIFFFKLIFIILGIAVGDEIGVIILSSVLLTNLVIIGIWIWGYTVQSDALWKSIKIAKAVLNLDDVEIARLNALCSELRYELLEYPWEIYWRLWVFFTP